MLSMVEDLSDNSPPITGYIYIMSNPSYKGIYKIGVSRTHPHKRREQLSASTSTITPFVLEYYLQCVSPFDAEVEVHEALAVYRVNENREFFRISFHEAVRAIERIVGVSKWADRYSSGGNEIATPFADLFAGFAQQPEGSEYENVLTPFERAACRELEAKLAQAKK